MTRTGAFLLAAAISLPFAGAALAATTATFKVSAEITPGCRIKTNEDSSADQLGIVDLGSHVVDGAYKNVQGSLLQNGNVLVQCTPGTAVSMSINGGSNQQINGLRHLREIRSGALIPYQVYRDAALSNVWQIDVPQALEYLDPNNVLIPLYVMTVLDRSHPRGEYRDVLTVTFSW